MNTKPDNAKAIAKKKKELKQLRVIAVIFCILAIIFFIIGIALYDTQRLASNGIMAFFAIMLTFVALTIGIYYYTKREIKYLEHPELRPVPKKAPTEHKPETARKHYRINPYTDEVEEDDGPSIEEIDFFESDIFDDM